MRKDPVTNKPVNYLNDRVVTKLFLSFFVLIFTYIFLNVIINNNNTLPHCTLIELLISFCCFMIFLLICYRLFKHNQLKKIPKIILFLIFICVQFLFAYYFAVKPSWDFGAVHLGAIDHINGSLKVYDNWYFYRYGNNLGLTLFLILYYGFFKAIGITCFVKLGIILNIIFIDITIIYIYKAFKLLFSSNLVDYFMILVLLFTPFITYVPIYYTDTLSMPFVAAGLFYYIKSLNTTNTKIKNISLILCGLVLGVGAIIKITTLIILIAIILAGVLNIRIKEIKSFCISSIILILTAIAPLLIISVFKNTYFDKNELDSKAFPYTHWVMMGMYNKGGYNHSDVEYTASFKTYKDKEKANIKELKKRFNHMLSNHTLVDFYTDKIVLVFGDGSLFAPEKLRREPVTNNPIKKIIFDSNSNRFYYCYSQIEWICVLLFIIVGIILRKYLNNRQRCVQLIIALTIFGLIIFFSLWEARSRYILNMTPVILIGGCLGAQSLINIIAERRKKHEK